MQTFAKTAPSPLIARDPRRRLIGWLSLFGLVTAVACGSSSTGPGPTSLLEGRWEGTSTTNVDYVYVFTATGKDSTNSRTGNIAPTYGLAATTTPGGSTTTTAWYEAPKAYWGNSSTGTITDDTTMTVQATGIPAFTMHKR